MAAPATPYAILTDPAECRRLWQEHGTIRGVARAVGCHPDVARKWLERAGVLQPGQRLRHWEQSDGAPQDPGRAIARERSDMEYVGQWARRVEIAPGIFLDLTHGAGGVAYAVSYKLQKAIEAYAPGDEPHILADGHYHVMLQVLRRGVWAYHPGCFEGQTGLLRRLKVHPVVGGWILTIHVDEPGRIGAIESQFLSFRERERDY